MVTIDESKSHIFYTMSGDKEQYLNHLNALLTALGRLHGDTIQDKNARETIAVMLAQMMPNENQLK